MSSVPISIQQKARALLTAEQTAATLAAQKEANTAAALIAEKEAKERNARIIAAAERQQALILAERLEAEATAAASLLAEKEAVAAEIARLKARTPIEILQEEVEELKRQHQAELELNKKELASLKKLVSSFIKGTYIIRHKNTGLPLYSNKGSAAMLPKRPEQEQEEEVSKGITWTLESV